MLCHCHHDSRGMSLMLSSPRVSRGTSLVQCLCCQDSTGMSLRLCHCHHDPRGMSLRLCLLPACPGLPAALLERKLGARTSLMLGSLLASLGLFSGGFARTLPALVVAVGVVAGRSRAPVGLEWRGTSQARACKSCTLGRKQRHACERARSYTARRI